MKLVAAGMSDREIAERLERSRMTVRSHIDSALQKFNARNRIHLSRISYEAGVLTGSESEETFPSEKNDPEPRAAKKRRKSKPARQQKAELEADWAASKPSTIERVVGREKKITSLSDSWQLGFSNKAAKAIKFAHSRTLNDAAQEKIKELLTSAGLEPNSSGVLTDIEIATAILLTQESTGRFVTAINTRETAAELIISAQLAEQEDVTNLTAGD